MRILHLALKAYGHLSDEVLTFPPEVGLHVVLGPNEAGKSTALEAVADGLFGFHPRSARAFLHSSDMLRVGLGLQAADGRQAEFVRRKGNKNTLQGPDGAPLPEAAIAAFLGGRDRKQFEDVFGLNGVRLRKGGQSILAEGGEAGAAILQAQTGLQGWRAAVATLDAQAKALHGRGKRRIDEAADRVRENRRLLNERSLSGTDYRRMQDALAALHEVIAGIAAEANALRVTQDRLQRIRRTAAPRAALAEATTALAALGAVRDLPPDAATRRQQALLGLDQAERDRRRAETEAGLLRARHDALKPEGAILAAADAIAGLAAQQAHFADMRDNRRDQQARAAQKERDLDRAGERMGVAERGAALRARIPPAPTRARVTRLATEHAALAARSAPAQRTLAEARAAVARATAAATAHPAPPAGNALRAALEAAQREGRIDDLLTAARDAYDDAAHAVAAALDALPLWSGPIDDLAAAPLPAPAEQARLAAALDAAAVALEAAGAALATHDAGLAETRAALLGLGALGALPTAAALVALRARRDAAWQMLRHQAVGDAPLPADADAMADGFASLVQEADALADRRWTEQQRVFEWERLEAQAARDEAMRVLLADALTAASERAQQAQAAWRDGWAAAGIAPLPPAAMRDWLRDRAAALDLQAAAAKAGRACDALRTRRDAALRALATASVQPAVLGLPALQAVAARLLEAQDKALSSHRQAVDDAAKAAPVLERAEHEAIALAEAFAAWRVEWEAAMAGIGLPPATDPRDAAAANELWADIEGHERDWSAAAQRVAEMDASLAAHAARCAGLSQAIGEPVSDTDIAPLHRRLTQAQAEVAEQARLCQEVARHEKEAADALRTGTAAADALAGLQALAGAKDDAALLDAIERAARRDGWAARLQEAGLQLQREGDGKSEAALQAEAEAVDADAIRGEVETIGEALRVLSERHTARVEERVRLESELAARAAGADVATPAQAMQDALLAIEEDAARYMRLRMAHRLLQAGIERHRRSQQAPLLRRASGYFAELTGGRYAEVEADADDRDVLVLMAVQPDGRRCPAEHLSEGTCDQLFLALRLASIALEAEHLEPLPFIADDLLVNFDDRRAEAAMRMLAAFGQTTQVILFTHHDHVAALASGARAVVHRLPSGRA